MKQCWIQYEKKLKNLPNTYNCSYRDCVTSWIIFLKAYYDKYVLSVQTLIIFTNFCFLLEGKYQTQSFSLLLWNCLLILKILPAIRFHLKRRFWHWKCLQEATCDSLKYVITKAAGDMLYSRAFSLQPMRGRHQRTSTNYTGWNFEEGFSKYFKN